MSNYFNSLSEKDKLNQLGKCRFMKSDEFSDGVNILIDKKWLFFKKLFKKKNISRKECLLLPFKTLKKIVSS